MSTLNVRRAALLAAHPSPTLDLRFMDGGGLDPRITFTRASVASYFDVAGTLQSAASGAPRFDYDPVTHAAKGLLIEEARTNLLLNSATLGTQSVTVTAAATTLSFYGTGTVTLSGTFAGSLVGSGAFPTRSTLTFTPTAGSLTCTVTGSVLNAQVETGAFATSWISTAGATATRAGDVATMPVGGWFNPAVSTLAVQAQQTGATYHNQAGATPVSLDNTSLVQRTSFNIKGSNSVAMYDLVSSLNADLGTPIAGSVWSASFAFAANAQAGCLNAGAVATASVASLTPSINQLSIGTQNGANFFGGYLRRVRYWPRALSGPELQAVTR